MHVLPRSNLFDCLAVYGFCVPLVVVSTIIAVVSVISLVLWLVGTTYHIPA
jgi:hypothetical protein